jgi:lipopolysaccharide transport system ATP-binding protein
MSESDVVIRVEGLGKKYSLHHEQSKRYTSLRDVVARQAKAAGRLLNPFTMAGQLRKAQLQAAKEHVASEEEFWALKDVSFEIRRGERVGIIGRNGAGKSTLLKILSRITEPTTGRVEIRGRVASLLEVGTGFHPELTGRENIYLNGAILGMTRWEIRSKFDEIVDFAEVEKFLDTPVKRYSSGMYVRLAFAVAAHLEPEILVVDEVLAVGDASFQKKCLGKMEDVAEREERTVLLVSHQMAAIRNLCSHGIVLDLGTLIFNGSAQESVEIYMLGSQDHLAMSSLRDRKDRKGSGNLRFVELTAYTAKGGVICSGDDIEILMTVSNYSSKAIRDVVVSLDICDQSGSILLMQRSSFQNKYFSVGPGESKIGCKIKRLPLCAGTYKINLFAAIQDVHALDWIAEAGRLHVEEGNYFGTGVNGMPSHCKILNEHSWVSALPISDHSLEVGG